MEELSEQTEARHPEHHHLWAIVVAILHHYAVFLVLLRVLNELPTVLYRVGGRHLRRRVLPILHGRKADGHMPLPGSRRENEV